MASYATELYADFRNNHSRSGLVMLERFYLRRLTEIAVNRFTWTGIPDDTDAMDIRPRYIELVLYRKGLCVFFYSKKFGKYLCLQGSTPGIQDMYFDPTSFHIYGNGSTPGIDGLTVSAKDGVAIWANRLRIPELDLISIYCRRLAHLDLTIETTIKNYRQPYLLYADDMTRQSVLQAYRMIEEGQPAIVFNKNTISGDTLKDSLGVLPLAGDKELLPNLLVSKKSIWNECLSHLGVNNANQEKRERLVAAEVGANDSEVLMNRNVSLTARQEACDQINEKFGLNLGCEWTFNKAATTDMPAWNPEFSEGSEDNGDVHDDGAEADSAEV